MTKPRPRLLKLGLTGLMLASLLALFAPPASADTLAISNTANTTTVWQTGTYNYVQNHTNDDFAIRIDSGPSLDARWVTCDGSQIGATSHYVGNGAGYVTIGTNFAAGTCLHLMFKGDSATGTWSGFAKWNLNFA
jgi:hypothetical protein